jgi:site-specific recombinase
MLIFHDLIDDMGSSLAQPRAHLLVLLVDRLRPTSSHDLDDIEYRLQRLIDTLTTKPSYAQVLRDYILALLATYHQVSLYADSGILAHENFGTALRQRVIWRVLPPLRQPTYLHDLFALCFHKKQDWLWINQVSDVQWDALLSLLATAQGRPELLIEAQSRILSALMIVSYRITAIGLEPEFIRAYPAINEFRSPFLAQNREMIDYVEAFKERMKTANETGDIEPLHAALADEKQTQVMLDQCRDILNKVKRGTSKHGVSLSLTNHVVRLEQCLNRLDLLFELLHDQPQQSRAAIAKLLIALTRAQLDDRSVRALVSINTELLARRVTENASRTGEHYVSTDRQGFWRMYRSAAGAGLIIASMATLKTLTGRLVLAPFARAVLFSLNYSFGFMLIHVLHCTVATKQPAMTAAALAATVQNTTGSKQAQLNELAHLTVNIMRTQFIAIVGNISIALPTGLLIAWLWQHQLGEALMPHDKAMLMLHDLHPFASLALFHAAIAGVWLFCAGLIAGYYDNLAIYHQVGARLRQHTTLQRWFGEPRLARVADYIEQNLGALAGNFWFGVMLGSTGTLGFILGLPIDIRHIAFASANFAQAAYHLQGSLTISVLLISLLGVVLIGITNLMVSFGLTLFVALRARRIHYAEWGALFRLILTHFVTRPSDFFWPPKHTPVADTPAPHHKT